MQSVTDAASTSRGLAASPSRRAASDREARLDSLGRLRVESVYPLGILRAWAYFDGDSQCLVYPAPRGHLPLPFAPATASGLTQLHGVGSDEFAGLRPYTPGDPVRAIAWKTLARNAR